MSLRQWLKKLDLRTAAGRRGEENLPDKARGDVHHREKLETLGLMVGRVAHDFNNLVTGISGAADALDLKFGRDNQEIRRYVEIIRQSCEKAERLTSLLLGQAREKPCQHTPVRLDDCVAETVELLACGLDKKIALEDQLDAGDAFIRGDKELLQCLLLNLAFNAQDAMPEGGKLQIKTRKAVLGEEDLKDSWLPAAPGEFVELSVRDNGGGIPEDIQAKIFEPFFTTKAAGKGTGLGLAGVYGLAKEHRAALKFDSKVGEGTCFYLYFPCLEDAVCLELSGCFLVVDDDPVLREMLVDILKDAGADAVTAADAETAEKLYTPGQFAAVLIDEVLPGISGGDLCRRLKKTDPDVKVLMMSGAELVEKAGRVDFIHKPYRRDEILKKLSCLLAKKQDS